MFFSYDVKNKEYKSPCSSESKDDQSCFLRGKETRELHFSQFSMEYLISDFNMS